MSNHICDCGAHYSSLGALEACQLNNHGQPSPPARETAPSDSEMVAAIFAKWRRADHMRLHAGEMTAQERRSVVAVLKAVECEVLAALSNRPATGGTQKGSDFAGCVEPHDDDERTVAIVRDAYGWTFGKDGRLCGLVAGDMGYASTNIVIDPEHILALADELRPATGGAVDAEGMRERAAKVADQYGEFANRDTPYALGGKTAARTIGKAIRSLSLGREG